MPLLDASQPQIQTLASFTAEELIAPQMEVDSPVEAIAHLALRMKAAGFVPDGAAVAAAALEREERCSTAMDFGFALPHARLEGIPGPCFALGLCARPLDWRGGRVMGVILLAVPESGATDYLRLVGGIARLSACKERLGKLRRGRTAVEILGLLGECSLKPSG